MKSLRPFIILALAAALLYFYAWPQWNKIATLRTQHVEVKSALSKAQEITQIRNQLNEQYNAISAADTAKIAKVVPAVYDPVKLIADINGLAVGYGMVIRGVAIVNPQEVSTSGAIQAPAPAEIYKKRQLSFTTAGQYRNFISFLSGLEQSLQLIDIERVEISAAQTTTKGSSAGTLDFKVTVDTYWIE